LNNSSKKK